MTVYSGFFGSERWMITGLTSVAQFSTDYKVSTHFYTHGVWVQPAAASMIKFMRYLPVT